MADRSSVQEPPQKHRRPAPQQSPVQPDAIDHPAHAEKPMLAASLDEQHLDWLENQQRSAGERWGTDLYIAGTCLLIVLTCIAGYLAVTNRLPF